MDESNLEIINNKRIDLAIGIIFKEERGFISTINEICNFHTANIIAELFNIRKEYLTDDIISSINAIYNSYTGTVIRDYKIIIQ